MTSASLRSAAATLLRCTLRGRCPACRQHSMFRGLYELHERCPGCGIRYESDSGAWVGALGVGYGFGALFAMALIVLELAAHPIREAGLDAMWAIAVLSLVFTALAYRPAKGAWFGLLYVSGFLNDETVGPQVARNGGQ